MVLQIFQKLSMDFTVSVCLYVCLSEPRSRHLGLCEKRAAQSQLQFDFLSLISGSELSDMSLEESDLLIEEQ